MASSIIAASNESAANADLKFTAAGAIYQAKTGTRKADITDHLNAKVGQLSAMLHLIVGEGLGRFQCMSDTIQDDYIWSCAMIADECKELVERL